jgi:hypothetical protein
MTFTFPHLTSYLNLNQIYFFLDDLSKQFHENEHIQSPKLASPDIEEPSIEKINFIPDLSLPMRK